jgi:hypothetical protein
LEVFNCAHAISSMREFPMKIPWCEFGAGFLIEIILAMAQRVIHPFAA